MTIQMKKVWFVDGQIIEQEIPESDIYKRHWDIASCKAYAEQLRDKNRANTAEHAAEAIEYLLALAEPKQKYHRGDRLICLETEEYCVIHISGTDRQWVKFPDSHIGVYTNEQVAELFELLPKEPEQEPRTHDQY